MGKPGSNDLPFARVLYDLEVDPLEQKNVVDKEEYADMVQELSDLLIAGWPAALPEGAR